MTRAGITGMRCAAEDIFAVADTLTADQWSLPSAAGGWSVHDVVAHIGCLMALLQAAVRGETLPDSGIEELNDEQVAGRRNWTPAQILADVHTQLDTAIPVFTALQDEPLASVLAPMLDLGSYPLHTIADMFAFDMTTHLRYDILGPRGPIPNHLAPLDEQRLAPAVSWLLGGIPQMQPELVTHLDVPLTLALTGPAAQQVLITRDSDHLVVRPCSEVDDAAPAIPSTTVITSTTADFLAWSTTRLPWADCVTISGDHAAAARFLNALNLI